MKKNFKKILCLVLALVMVMAFAGCGKKEEAGSLRSDQGKRIHPRRHGRNISSEYLSRCRR